MIYSANRGKKTYLVQESYVDKYSSMKLKDNTRDTKKRKQMKDIQMESGRDDPIDHQALLLAYYYQTL